jgi:hypothetical protein
MVSIYEFLNILTARCVDCLADLAALRFMPFAVRVQERFEGMKLYLKAPGHPVSHTAELDIFE